LTKNLRNTPNNFCGGKTRFAFKEWCQLTSDTDILNWIKGIKLDFVNNVVQDKGPPPIHFSDSEREKMNVQIVRMLDKGIIETTCASNVQFVSNVFCRPKKDGSVRIILNLKLLNRDIEYHHFKMETLAHVIQLLSKNCFLASVDLKDAYFSIPVDKAHRCFLRFYWNKVLYQFTCLPNGLAEAPRKFTKILKVPFAWLRARGFENSAYIDDSCLVAESFDKCTDNVNHTIELLDKLGFTLHPEKSCLVPTQVLVYLGFVLNTIRMVVSLTSEKRDKIINKCKLLLKKLTCSIRELAEVIGSVVAAEPGVDFAPLHYKRLEHHKDRFMKQVGGDYEAIIPIDKIVREDLVWWIENLEKVEKQLERNKPDIQLTSDSSDFAWGGTRDGVSAGGPWTAEEKRWHINVKELLAAFLTLKTFCDKENKVHIRLLLDNVTSVVYVNAQGGRKPLLNDIARKIWLWAIEREIWLTAEHLPGVNNCLADTASRKKYSLEGEWMLNKDIFDSINAKFGPFDLDLFATRINSQCEKFFAWHKDPDAIGIDAMLHEWRANNIYGFPPFSIIGKVLRKIKEEELEVSLILPLWPSQFWFGRALHMVVEAPRLLPKSKEILVLPQEPDRVHSLWNKLKLTLFKLSGNPSKVKDFQQKLQPSLGKLGEKGLRDNIGLITRNGCFFVINEKLVHCLHL